MFKRTDSTWTQEAKLLPSDGVANDMFGWSASISGDYAVVGSIFDDDNGTDASSAYIFSGFTSGEGADNEREGVPSELSLLQNYPNPFNPETVIEYELPVQSDVSLIVYNLRGREVANLISGTKPAGFHQITWDASQLASGVYLYRLQADDFVQTKKMLLLK